MMDNDNSAAEIPCVIAVDPGRSKCGVAIVSPNPGSPRSRVHWRSVEPTATTVATVAKLAQQWAPVAVLVGNGTEGKVLLRGLRRELEPLFRVVPVPEENTSRRARERVVSDSLPRGIARLVPRGMRVPNQPWDDVVAILLAEDWFAAGGLCPAPVDDATPARTETSGADEC